MAPFLHHQLCKLTMLAAPPVASGGARNTRRCNIFVHSFRALSGERAPPMDPALLLRRNEGLATRCAAPQAPLRAARRAGHTQTRAN
mmetsp:Transcript_8316/g.33677  ORF Transcript_8316/g.33677 Transcript_8316/m.33677 type:complete len:87 (-) Transcript_8316:1873-2133(-)